MRVAPEVTTAGPTVDARQRSGARAAAVNAVALAIFLTVYVNALWPAVRLTSALANSLVFLGASALPWVALVAGQRALRKWAAAAHAALLTPVLLLTLPLGMCSALTAEDTAERGVDYSFEVQRTLSSGPSRVRVYRTNCGVPCDFGVVVRHERPFLPGLLVVRELGIWNHADDAALRLVPGGIEVTIVPTNGSYHVEASPHRYALRPWVRF